MEPDHACIWATCADVYLTANTLMGVIVAPWVFAFALLCAWVGVTIWRGGE